MAVPLYQKISDELKQTILSQTIKIGEQLPTEKELSEHYHVSRITAKRALTELEQMGFVTRTRGKGTFVKETTARPIRRENKRILFIIPFEGMSFGDFTTALVPMMKAEEATLFITYSNYLKENTAAVVRENFDGLIYYPLHTEDFLDVLLELSLHHFPIVVLDKKIIDLPFPCVYADNFNGGEQATRLLIEQGHQRIAYVMSNEAHHPHTTRNRYLGYIKALKSRQLAFHTSIEEVATENRILDLVKSEAVTALVCENDLVALNTMRILQEKGYAVPQDISIIGFDNIQAASLSQPALTTIAQDFSRMGKTAGELLMKWLKTGKVPGDVKIPIQLVKRQSTFDLKRK